MTDTEGATGTAIARICRDLDLPMGDAYAQDWVYELPEEYRTESFLALYLDAYATQEYGGAERQVLMQLMFDITNDLLGQDEEAARRAWDDIGEYVRRDAALHRDLLDHWVLAGEPLEDAFRLTPMARRLHDEVYG
jgi:hypothetical protein